MKRLIDSKKISTQRNDADYLSTFDPLPISVSLNLPPASLSHSAPPSLFSLTDTFLTTKYLSTSDFPSPLPSPSLAESEAEAVAEDTEQLIHLLDSFSSLLSTQSLSLRTDAIAVNLLIPDMSRFPALNAVYSKYFG